MSAHKRSASVSLDSSQVVKRQKSDTGLDTSSGVVTKRADHYGALTQATARPFALQAPVMELTGHQGAIFAARFDPSGENIASGSMDRSIFLWKAGGACENYSVLNGHKCPVLDVRWSRDSQILFSASGDLTLASWDVDKCQRIRRYYGHEEPINCIDVSKRGSEVVVSGSDDDRVMIWDPREKEAIGQIETQFPVTAIALSEAGSELFTGGIDNDIKVWDLRKRAVVYSLLGHNETVTSLEISPDSTTLLSHSHDSTVRTWNVQPFAPTERHIRTYDGATVGIERNLLRASWDAKGKRIVAGSGDQTVVVWDAFTGKLLGKLPGHRGSVNDARFSPLDEASIVLSASSDHTLVLGELGK